MFRKQREIQELGVAVLELLVSMLAAVLVSFILVIIFITFSVEVTL